MLVAPADIKAQPIDLDAQTDLLGLLGKEARLAMGEPKSVPAGNYAEKALTSLGLWNKVKNRIALTESVRAALIFVARGEAPLGIVYRSDAHAEPKVKVLGTFPETSHPRIVYPVAMVAASMNPESLSSLQGSAPTSANSFNSGRACEAAGLSEPSRHNSDLLTSQIRVRKRMSLGEKPCCHEGTVCVWLGWLRQRASAD